MGQALLDDGHEVKRVHGDEFTVYWPFIEIELDRVPHIWEPWWSKEDLYVGVISGRFQLWGAGTKTAIQIMVFTQVAEFPAGPILQGVIVVGNSLEENLPVLAGAMENFARIMQCKRFEIHGRRGWGRKLKRYGPRETCVLSFPISLERAN